MPFEDAIEQLPPNQITKLVARRVFKEKHHHIFCRLLFRIQFNVRVELLGKENTSTPSNESVPLDCKPDSVWSPSTESAGKWSRPFVEAGAHICGQNRSVTQVPRCGAKFFEWSSFSLVFLCE